LTDDLFSWKPPEGYPLAPGFKEPTTAKAAAKAAGLTASRMRDDVMKAYAVAWPNGMTADEAAEKLGRSVLSIRPRVSELRRLGLLFPALYPAPPGVDPKPLRRVNGSGLMATVLVCKKPETA
jgi:hypothetical protein